MERLTWPRAGQSKDDTTISKVCKKLCDYEDTGLSPDEILNLKTQLKETDEILALQSDDLISTQNDRDKMKRAFEVACSLLAEKVKGWPPNMSEIFDDTSQAWMAYALKQAEAEKD